MAPGPLPQEALVHGSGHAPQGVASAIIDCASSAVVCWIKARKDGWAVLPTLELWELYISQLMQSDELLDGLRGLCLGSPHAEESWQRNGLHRSGAGSRIRRPAGFIPTTPILRSQASLLQNVGARIVPVQGLLHLAPKTTAKLRAGGLLRGRREDRGLAARHRGALCLRSLSIHFLQSLKPAATSLSLLLSLAEGANGGSPAKPAPASPRGCRCRRCEA